MHRAVVSLTCLLLFTATLHAQKTTGLAQLLRTEIAVKSLDLSGEQREKVEASFKQAREAINALRASEKPDKEMRAAGRDVVTQLRRDLGEILTPQQRTKLMSTLREDDASDDDKPAAPPPASQPAVLAIGQAAGELSLLDLQGKAVPPKPLSFETTVLVFGSYSSPLFRDRMAQLDGFAKQMGSRVKVRVVYTAEAYPKGQWEVQRNLDKDISVEQHADLAARLAAAKEAEKILAFKTPMLVEPFGSTLSQQLDVFPSGAVILKDGVLVYRQQWLDFYALQAELEKK